MRRLGAALLAPVAVAAYSFYEAHTYRLTRRRVPVRAGVPALRILHLTDTHLKPRNRRLISFLERLPQEVGDVPDLVLATGDLIESDEAIEPLVQCFGSVEGRLGRFYVLGSHDYYEPRFEAYTKYLTGRRPVRRPRRTGTARLEEGLREKGWRPLTNAAETLDTPHGRIRVAGVDDPYVGRHRTGHIARRADEVLAIGLVHSPDVVSEWVLQGFDLVVAGHTHGGQIRLPGIGAVVTNCSLPTGLAGGLSRVGGTWLHAGRGLGCGAFAPVRLGCPPEATLLELSPARLNPHPHRAGR